MSILTANLKHLYQRRGVWFWYLIILCQLPVIYIFLFARTERYLGYLIISYFIGLVAGSMQREILSKPFSFCLPGHSEIPRRFIFRVGIVVNGLLGFVFMFYPGLEFPSAVLAVLAGSIVGVMVYLFFAYVTFCNYQNNNIIAPFFFITAFAGFYFKWDMIVQKMIVTSPLIVTSSGLLLCWFIWRWLGRESLSRKYCGKMAIGVFDGWNKEKMLKFQQIKLAEKDKKKSGSMRISSGAERFFVSRISRAETGSLQQYIWGSLYKSFGTIVSQRRHEWMKFLIFILPALCFLCYIPVGVKNAIFFLPVMMFAAINLWVYSSLSVSGGRRQRFWSALTLAVTTGIFVTVAAVLLAMSTQLLARIMPQLTVRGQEYTFEALNLNFSVVPFLLIPVALTIGLIFHKKPILHMLLVMVIFQILFAFSIVRKLTIMGWPVQIGPVHVMIMMLCGWAVFIAVLRYVSMRCCLVSQSR